jgi:hypothetical protein
MSISTGLWAGRPDVDSRNGQGFFLFLTAPRPAVGSTQPPIQWEPGALFLRLKWPGRETNHSSTSGAEVKNAWICASTLPCLNGVVPGYVQNTFSWRGT